MNEERLSAIETKVSNVEIKIEYLKNYVERIELMFKEQWERREKVSSDEREKIDKKLEGLRVEIAKSNENKNSLEKKALIAIISAGISVITFLFSFIAFLMNKLHIL